MTRTTALLAALVLAACANAAHPRPTAIDPAITQYLLTSAATDLKAYGRSTPPRVRDVRVGFVVTSDGVRQYLLCGQFAAKGAWIPFATTRTSGYEQVLGEAATTACQRPAITWGTDGDLTSSLQSRLDDRS